LDAETVLFYSNGVRLQKIGRVKYKGKHDFSQSKLYNTRVSFQGKKWILAFSIEVPNEQRTLNDFSVGIDLGVKTLAVLSCQGKFYKSKNINRSHKMVRLDKQLKHQQRALSRKQKGSKNRIKAREKVRKLYGRISRIRHDYAHKITTKIVEMLPKRVIIEDLNVVGMVKNKRLARAISNQNFHRFRSLLEYKAKERGIELKVADRFFPSSKKCSNCGSIKQDLKLSDRIYKCACGLEIDRDENAALNLVKVV